MFTLAIKRKSVNIVFEVLKNLCLMSQDKFNSIAKWIPLWHLIKLNNAYIEPLIKDAMVKPISDRNQSLPMISR